MYLILATAPRQRCESTPSAARLAHSSFERTRSRCVIHSADRAGAFGPWAFRSIPPLPPTPRSCSSTTPSSRNRCPVRPSSHSQAPVTLIIINWSSLCVCSLCRPGDGAAHHGPAHRQVLRKAPRPFSLPGSSAQAALEPPRPGHRCAKESNTRSWSFVRVRCLTSFVSTHRPHQPARAGRPEVDAAGTAAVPRGPPRLRAHSRRPPCRPQEG